MAATKQPNGIICPIVTPFRDNEELDLPQLRSHIDYLLAAGVHGIFVSGSTGECCLLDESEKQLLISTAVEHVNHRVPVYAGTGAESTREAIRLTKMAQREGVDGVSIITPYFIMPSQAELFDHYRRIAGEASLPIILYSNPATCGGLRIEPETVARLAELPNIVGIKDSSGDLQNLIEIVRLVPATFSVMQGRDTLIYPALIFGAQGAVPATSNLAPQWCVEIYEAFRKGDHAAAKTAQLRLSPIRLSLMLGTAPGAVKAALALLGRSMGPSRLPIGQLSAEQQMKLQNVLRLAGLL